MIWERLGQPDVYAEPFFGSGAVLLGRPGGAPPRGREVVSDTDGYIVNFWRAMAADPEAVARAADWPTFHDDLTARHRWLIEWGAEHHERVATDAEWFDARAAGWWAWGLSNWIGSGWCLDAPDRQPGQVPHLGSELGGSGANAQRAALRVGTTAGGGVGCNAQAGWDKRPALRASGGDGRGVQSGLDRRPQVGDSLKGNGVQPHGWPAPADEWIAGERLLPWFRALQARLLRVVVLNRGWESCVTPTVLCQTPSRRLLTAGVFLDPPYSTEQRQAGIYRHDDDGDVAAASWSWAREHGGRIRVAYACMEGDVEVPAGWRAEAMQFGGYSGRAGRKESKSRDQVLFSPACVGQRALF